MMYLYSPIFPVLLYNDMEGAMTTCFIGFAANLLDLYRSTACVW